ATDSTARDVSWLSISFFPMLSTDGSLLIFGDGSDVAGDNYAIMLRRTDGSPAIRIGEGGDLSLSRDNQWVLSSVPSVPVKLMMFPTGAGTARRLDNGEFASIIAGSFLGDGSQIVVCGNEPKHAVRCYVKSLSGGTFKPITPEGVITIGGVRGAVTSPDGGSLAALTETGFRVFSTRDGTSQSVPGLSPSDRLLRYSPDGRFLWARQMSAEQVRIDQVDLKTGARSLLMTGFGAQRPGVMEVREVALADNPRTYAFMEKEVVSYLFELKRMQK
ncbi:MAG: hypothetical protein ABJC63_08570, partial [Gemmatimonadales bacterium]